MRKQKKCNEDKHCKCDGLCFENDPELTLVSREYLDQLHERIEDYKKVIYILSKEVR